MGLRVMSEPRPGTRWQRIGMRALGALSVGYFAIGLPLTFLQAALIRAAKESASTNAPYVVTMFIANVLANFAFLIALLWTGVALLLLRPNILRTCAYLYAAELLWYLGYLLIAATATFHPGPLNQSVAQIPAIGGGVLGPQIFTAFPIVGLLAVYLMHRGLGQGVSTSS